MVQPYAWAQTTLDPPVAQEPGLVGQVGQRRGVSDLGDLRGRGLVEAVPARQGPDQDGVQRNACASVEPHGARLQEGRQLRLKSL